MGTIIGQVGTINQQAPVAVEDPVREVVRCGECSLVQFRTVSDKCRRCSKALPSLKPLEEEPVAAADLDSSSPFEDVDDGQPVARAERNRRVGMGSRLRACRIKMGLTQIEMAEKLQIPRTYLSRIENDRLLPGPLMIAKFASDLGINVSDVLPSLSAQLDGDRRWDGISRRIINIFADMEAAQQQQVLDAIRGMVASNVGRIEPGTSNVISMPAARATA
jgi:transcriptional regulator with XRE-family HTH domain